MHNKHVVYIKTMSFKTITKLYLHVFTKNYEFEALILKKTILQTISKKKVVNNKQLLGKRIKELRKAQGLTQEQLAELIDIETGSLSAIESGRHFPSLPTLEKIAHYINTELEYPFKFTSILSVKEMREKIIKNIDKLSDENIKFIYKFFEHIK